MTKEELFIAIIALEALAKKNKDNSEAVLKSEALESVAKQLDSVLEDMFVNKRKKAKLTLLPWDED